MYPQKDSCGPGVSRKNATLNVFAEARADRSEFWKEFAMLYHEQRILWAHEHSSYNLKARRAAYEVLVNKMREMYPEASLNFTKRKVLSLRTAARREDRKIRTYRKACREYKPTWYLYPYLEFIYGDNNTSKASELEESRNSDQDLDEPRSIDHHLYESDIIECHQEQARTPEGELEAPLLKKFKTELSDDYAYEMGCGKNLSTIQLPSRGKDPQKLEYFYADIGARNASLEQSHLNIGKKSDEEAELLGKSWCLEYKGLSREQQIHARRAIEEIFFEAKLGMLQRGSVKIN